MGAEAFKMDTVAWGTFPKKWVSLKRAKTGYVVYEPCDGKTPAIDFDSFKLTIEGQWQDGPTDFEIRSFQKTGEHEYQTISISDWARVKLKMRLVGPKLNLWLFDGFVIEGESEQYLRWVVTTESNSKKFPVIKNPCPTMKIPEKQFLKDEF